MGHYSDNPVADAQDHFRSMDEREDVMPDPDYFCVACDEGFYCNQNGMLVDEEPFCTNCMENKKHIAYYAEKELTERDYNKSINNIKKV
jgi:hypothetical protein